MKTDLVEPPSIPPSSLDDDLSAVQRVREALERVLRGKSDVIGRVLVCLLAKGHLLIEDRPGLGKTTLAKGLAAAIGGRFARVQCTPDLLPSDVTGFNVFDQRSGKFEFRRGPVFSDVLLSDEINRATPRTQSALLEAMAERQVTVDAERYVLSDEFFVIATQNPSEQHGTYPLPEAQLDRFAMKLSVGYPDRTDEADMLRAALGGVEDGSSTVPTILAPDQLRRIQSEVSQVEVAAPLREYLVDLARATRTHPDVSLGLSPRGLLTWQRTAQAAAYLDRRAYVVPGDIRAVAEPVLEVRLGIDHDDPLPVIRGLLESVPLPPYEAPAATTSGRRREVAR